jgi:two-component system chemotaxis response regulator CheB
LSESSTGRRPRTHDEARVSDQVIALVASIGGLHALAEVLGCLPADFGAALVIVQHLEPGRQSQMAEILGRRTKLVVEQAGSHCRLCPGVAWVAPPNYHLLVDASGWLSLTQSDRVHFVRPAAEPLLVSLAAHFGPRATAVILTGSGLDGSLGVRAIKGAGGTVIVQDRVTSRHWGMPGAAIATGCVDQILPLDEIGPALLNLIAMRRVHG